MEKSLIIRWLGVPTIIALSLGGIVESIDRIKYDLLGKARNIPEANTRHMIADHLTEKEEVKSWVVRLPSEFLTINVSLDGCVVLKRKTIEGMVTSNTVVPAPKMADKIKELYSENDFNLAYAMELVFNLGAHKKDYAYDESKKDSSMLRTYKDGCVLRYEFDKYGVTQHWQWIKYQH